MSTDGSGPLRGIKVIELSGLGPAPLCATLLADNGAQVVRIERPGVADLGIAHGPRFDLAARARRRVAVDLKSAADRDKFMQLVRRADMLLDPFRPGVVERLGIAPEDCWRFNRKLVYGRLTGWGQSGPLARTAGHDINFLALSGVLLAIGPRERPVPPLNLVADMAAGAMFMAFGLLAAYVDARRSGVGQVVDVAMTDCAAYLALWLQGLRAAGQWNDDRESNFVDGGAPYYGCYETLDGKFVAVGAIERRFFARLLEGLGLDIDQLPDAADRSSWPGLKKQLAEAFRRRTRDEWTQHFAGSDACVSPVLDWDEASAHPQARARNNTIEIDGIRQPAPAPKFSACPAGVPDPPSRKRGTLDAAIDEWSTVRAT